jgi:hypothetical protein
MPDFSKKPIQSDEEVDVSEESFVLQHTGAV